MGGMPFHMCAMAVLHLHMCHTCATRVPLMCHCVCRYDVFQTSDEGKRLELKIPSTSPPNVCGGGGVGGGGDGRGGRATTVALNGSAVASTSLSGAEGARVDLATSASGAAEEPRLKKGGKGKKGKTGKKGKGAKRDVDTEGKGFPEEEVCVQKYA